ncbi:MAG: PEP-CTERM sorting domain-containing protein [Planctomycetales bacterium]|nr:PEP-CTERM sorting domain-containing protein [Planctomycetales bacterium]
MTHSPMRYLQLVSALLVGFLTCASASAVDFNWNVAGPADWNDGANWNPAGPPSGGGGNAAFVNNGGTAEISGDIADIQDIFVGDAGGTGTLNQSAGNTFQGTGSWMFVGQDAGSVGTYNLSGGTQGKDRLYVGQDGGTGTLNLSGSGVVGGGLLIVGVNGGSGTVAITETGSAQTSGNVEFHNASMSMTDDGLIDSGNEVWFGNGGGNSTTADIDSGVVEADTWIAIGRDGATGVVNLSGDAVMRKVAVNDGDDGNLTNSERSFITLGGVGSGGKGTLNISGNAIVESDTGMTVGESSNNTGIVNQSGGTVTVHDWTPAVEGNQPFGYSLTIGTELQDGSQNTGDNEYVLSGGTLNAETIVLNHGLFKKTGGVLNFTGFEMNGGTLSADVFPSDLVQDGGTTSPGNSPGTMTITGNYSLNSGDLFMEIEGTGAGTGYDQLIVTGDVSLAGDLTLAGAYVPVFGESFTLIDNQGSNAISGGFTGLAEGSTVVFNGVGLSVSYLGGDGNDFVLTAVPEPAALALLAIGSLGWIVRRRRR